MPNKTNYSETFVRKVKKETGLKTYKVEKVSDRNSKKNFRQKSKPEFSKVILSAIMFAVLSTTKLMC